MPGFLFKGRCEMRAGNGNGTVRKLSGKRNKPYQALVTVGDKVVNDKIVPDRLSLGCYATKREARMACYEYFRNPLNAEDYNITLATVFAHVESEKEWKKAMESAMVNAFNKVKYFHNKRMRDIKLRDVELMAQLVDGTSGSTQNAMKIMIHFCFEWSIKHDIVNKDYSKYMEFKHTAQRKDKTAYTKEEIELARTDDMQMLMLYTGMRISEATGMKMEQVKEENGIFYFEIVRGKTASSARKIPVHPQIMYLIEDRSKTYVIEPHIGDNMYRKRYKKLGLPHTPHDCRRTFATYAKRCGMDEFYRKAILGHSQGNITDGVYTDFMLDIAYKEICKLEY